MTTYFLAIFLTFLLNVNAIHLLRAHNANDIKNFSLKQLNNLAEAS